jgi:hypothetical protein
MQLYAQWQQGEPDKELYVGKKNLRLRVPRAEREFSE